MNRINIISGLAVLLLVTAVSAKTIDKHFNKIYKSVDDQTVLELKHGDGDVVVRSWDRDEVEVDVRYRAKISGLGASDDFDVDFEQRGNRIKIVGKEPAFSFGLFGMRTYEYVYTIHAPAYVQLDLHGADGDVDISERRADITIKNADGDVHIRDVVNEQTRLSMVDGDCELDNISGNLEIHCVDGDVWLNEIESRDCNIQAIDGDITIRHASGVFQIQAVDGDIQMRDAYADKVQINASDGDIDLDLRTVRRINADVQTGDGDIRVRIEKDLSAEVQISTGDGNIRADLSRASQVNTGEDYYSCVLNDGNGSIRIRTGDGDVCLGN
ncbi:MAG: DUF4097 family beta strand repeat-containing protein [candidate division KSB1 bacterium]|nr:DUF4097 family beta strand repeat-containing protein [candidate division KSB1 bacterium]